LFEPDLAGDGFSVDGRSVGAAKVPQTEAKLIERKDAMVAADRFTVRSKMAVLFPSDQELAIRVQRNQFAVVLTTNGLQFSSQHRNSPKPHA
jgi:hypothetical protein